MRKFGLILGVAAVAFLGACSHNKSSSNAGAMGAKQTCTDKKDGCCKDAAGNMGAGGEKTDC